MKSILLILLAPILLAACTADTPEVSEIDSVRAGFDAYKEAMRLNNPEVVVNWVDGTTLNYYDKILAAAASADSSEVRGMNLLDKMMVLQIRQKIPADTVLNMDASELFVYTIRHGMIGEVNLRKLELGTIEVHGDAATGQLVIDGKPSSLKFRFTKEEGKWKIDLTSLFPQSLSAMQRTMEKNGWDEDKLISFQLDNEMRQDVWHPLERTATGR